MTSVYTGQDIIKFTYGKETRVINDLADNEVVQITYPNDTSSTSTGKNGNSLGAHNEQGNIAELTMRLVKSSGDDKFFNSIWADWKNHSLGFKPMTAEFTKVLVDEQGNSNSEVTQLFFGLPRGKIGTGSNLSGETEQAVSIYNFRFGNSQRTIE